MADRERETQEAKKRPVWSLVEKIISISVGVIITTMLGYMLASWGSARDMAVQIAGLTEQNTNLQRRLHERENGKRSTGRTRDEQMQFNSVRLGSVVEYLRRIDKEEEKLKSSMDNHIERAHTSNMGLSRRISNIEQSCAKLAGQLQNGKR